MDSPSLRRREGADVNIAPVVVVAFAKAAAVDAAVVAVETQHLPPTDVLWFWLLTPW